LIKYALQCDSAHEFEVWFSSSSDFDAQLKRGFITCPVCNSSKIKKQLMRPSVSSAGNRRQDNLPVVSQSGMNPELVSRLRALRKEVERNSEDVGERFPDEARSIHYGEKPQRGIRGKASVKEARELFDEGVGVLPLPVLPEENN